MAKMDSVDGSATSLVRDDRMSNEDDDRSLRVDIAHSHKSPDADTLGSNSNDTTTTKLSILFLLLIIFNVSLLSEFMTRRNLLTVVYLVVFMANTIFAKRILAGSRKFKYILHSITTINLINLAANVGLNIQMTSSASEKYSVVLYFLDVLVVEDGTYWPLVIKLSRLVSNIAVCSGLIVLINRHYTRNVLFFYRESAVWMSYGIKFLFATVLLSNSIVSVDVISFPYFCILMMCIMDFNEYFVGILTNITACIQLLFIYCFQLFETISHSNVLEPKEGGHLLCGAELSVSRLFGLVLMLILCNFYLGSNRLSTIRLRDRIKKKRFLISVYQLADENMLFCICLMVLSVTLKSVIGFFVLLSGIVSLFPNHLSNKSLTRYVKYLVLGDIFLYYARHLETSNAVGSDFVYFLLSITIIQFLDIIYIHDTKRDGFSHERSEDPEKQDVPMYLKNLLVRFSTVFVTYMCGIENVNVINFVFIVFFIYSMIANGIYANYWFFLILYTGSVTLLQYAFLVVYDYLLGTEYYNEKVYSMIGLEVSDSGFWRLLTQFAIILLGIAQYSTCKHKKKPKVDDLFKNKEMSQNLVVNVICYIRRFTNEYWSYITTILLLVIVLPSFKVSLIHLVFICIFFYVLLLKALGANEILFYSWTPILMYEGLVILLNYSCRFEEVFAIFTDILGEKTMQDIGVLIPYDTMAPSGFLMEYILLVIVSVAEFKMLRNVRKNGEEQDLSIPVSTRYKEIYPVLLNAVCFSIMVYYVTYINVINSLGLILVSVLMVVNSEEKHNRSSWNEMLVMVYLMITAIVKYCLNLNVCMHYLWTSNGKWFAGLGEVIGNQYNLYIEVLYVLLMFELLVFKKKSADNARHNTDNKPKSMFMCHVSTEIRRFLDKFDLEIVASLNLLNSLVKFNVFGYFYILMTLVVMKFNKKNIRERPCLRWFKIYNTTVLFVILCQYCWIIVDSQRNVVFLGGGIYSYQIVLDIIIFTASSMVIRSNSSKEEAEGGSESDLPREVSLGSFQKIYYKYFVWLILISFFVVGIYSTDILSLTFLLISLYLMNFGESIATHERERNIIKRLWILPYMYSFVVLTAHLYIFCNPRRINDGVISVFLVYIADVFEIHKEFNNNVLFNRIIFVYLSFLLVMVQKRFFEDRLFPILLQEIDNEKDRGYAMAKRYYMKLSDEVKNSGRMYRSEARRFREKIKGLNHESFGGIQDWIKLGTEDINNIEGFPEDNVVMEDVKNNTGDRNGSLCSTEKGSLSVEDVVGRGCIQTFITFLYRQSWFYRELLYIETTGEDLKKLNSDTSLYNMAKHFVLASYYLLASNIPFVIFLMLCLDNVINGSLLTIVPLVGFLVFGFTNRPYVSERFIRSLIFYVDFCIIIRYLFQSSYFSFNDIHRYANGGFNTMNGRTTLSFTDAFANNWICYLGIDKKHDILGDFVIKFGVLMLLMLERKNMRLLGIWEFGPHEDKFKHLIRNFEDKDQLKEDFVLQLKKGVREQGVLWKVKEYFRQLNKNEIMPSRDFYQLMVIFDLVSFLMTIVFWTSFSGKENISDLASGSEFVSQLLLSNKVPSLFVVVSIINFSVMIIDRAIYMSRSIMCKFWLQVLSIFSYHVWIFFIIPSKTNTLFCSNLPLKLFYLFKCLYWLVSAKQIKYGFANFRILSFVEGNYGSFNSMLFSIYRSIPFLFEIKEIVDWGLTDSTLTIQQWLKFEDIFFNIFMIKCQRETGKNQPRKFGEIQPNLSKKINSLVLILVLVFLIWLPLIILSLPGSLKPNPILSVKCRIRLNDFQPFSEFNSIAVNHIKRKMQKIEFERLDQDVLPPISSNEHIQNITLSSNPNSIWTISPPSLQQMLVFLSPSGKEHASSSDVDANRVMDNTRDAMFIVEWELTHKDQSVSHGKKVRHLSDKEKADLYRLLSDEDTGEIELFDVLPEGIYSFPLGLSYEVKIKGKKHSHYKFVKKKYSQHSNNEEGRIYYFCLDLQDKEDHRHGNPFIFIYSQEVPTISYIGSVGITGLYVTIVLTAGKFLRMMVTDMTSKIMFEDLPQVDNILELCRAIIISRELGDYTMEETLYWQLITLFRSPDSLIEQTRIKQ